MTKRAQQKQNTRANSFSGHTIKRKKKESFSLYIYKVLKEISIGKEQKGINKKAMGIMNSMVQDIFEQITILAAQLMRYNNKKTLTDKEIETCVKLLLPQELAMHAMQEGRKAVNKFKETD